MHGEGREHWVGDCRSAALPSCTDPAEAGHQGVEPPVQVGGRELSSSTVWHLGSAQTAVPSGVRLTTEPQPCEVFEDDVIII